MRRVLPLIAVMMLAFAPLPFPKPDSTVADLEKMQGEWVLASATSSSEMVPPLPPESLVLSGNRFRMTGDDTKNPWTVVLDAKARPKRMDLRPNGPCSALRAVYALQGDTLRVCWADTPPPARRPDDLSGAGDTIITWVFKRKKV